MKGMDTKTCNTCNTEQPLENFPRHPNMRDGFINRCKPCHKIYKQQNYEKKRDYYQAYDRERNTLPERQQQSRDSYARQVERNREKFRQKNKESYARNRERYLAYHAKERAKHPEKRKARKVLYDAIQRGQIQRQPCEKCGDVKSHGHHEDYSKPLEVMWLCSIHHGARHKELRMAGIEIPY